MISLSDITYRGRQSIRISNGCIEAVFFQDFGAKFVSFRNLETDYEFLWQGCEAVHPQPEYGSLYVENDLCGADDIFPSINPCFFPTGPWKGSECPPHGELWSIPWTTEKDSTTLVFRTRGVRFPYEIERRVSLPGNRTLRFDYRLSNLSPFEMPGIWAFHPLFNAGSDTRVILPEGTNRIVNTLNFRNRLGKVGDTHNWPKTLDKSRNSYDLGAFVPNCGVCEKFFINGEITSRRCRLQRDVDGSSVDIRFSEFPITYLGFWINQGGLLGQNNIAVEPATGCYDDVYLASKLEECNIIPANGEWSYHLEFEVI